MRAGVRPSSTAPLRDIRHAYSGIYATQHQDLAMIETMGAISDRSKEHLGGSDIGIIGLRERLVEAAQAFLAGAEPPALLPAVRYPDVRSVSGVLPKGQDWRSITWSKGSIS